MNALHPAPVPLRAISLRAAEPESPWEARGLADLVPPATLGEARARRDELASLLGRERAAAADFLLALADFDRRRGWERLGHASLFAFLTRELGLSKGAAYLRYTAARLLPRHPAVEQALRSGALCLSAVGELSRVITPENEGDVLPRLLGCSAREAREVVAAILPEPHPPRRELVTAPPARVEARHEPQPGLLKLAGAGRMAAPAGAASSSRPAATVVLTSEPALTHPTRVPRAEVEPMTADMRRLHLTVSAGFLDKVATARTGLSHAMPRATMEQVLEAALDLLLEKQARRKALVKRPRGAQASPTPNPTSTPAPAPTPTPNPTPTSTPTPTPSPTSTPTPTPSPTDARPHVPAAVEREVRLRDGDRCQWPLDAGGVCGSTWQVELDHIRPEVLGGPTEVGNLRCACRVHNQRAAVLELGEGLVGSAKARRAERASSATRSGAPSGVRRGRGTGAP